MTSQMASMYDIANAKARVNLGRVVKAVGARFTSDSSVFLEAGGFGFVVLPHSVYRMRKSNEEGTYFPERSTCIYTKSNADRGGIPIAEIVASAVLLLHHNPNIFEAWCRQDGYYGL